MKRVSKSLGGLFFIIAVLLAVSSPLIIWHLLPEHQQSILVIDKTVPIKNYREHSSLFWTLNYLKQLNGSGRWFPDTDYLGWYPERIDSEGHAVRLDLEKDALRNKETLIVADTYGVYVDDLAEKKPKGWSPDYSPRLFGGFNIDEATYIEEFVGRGGNLVTEFNTFASPTTGEARKKLEKLLGAGWTEWSGRFFRELSDISEVPAWARRNYLKHYKEVWDFKGPGWMFTHEDTRIIVLLSGVDTTGQELDIEVVDKDNILTKGLPVLTPYYYWFDIVKPFEGVEVPAYFQFSLTSKGSKKLAAFEVPERFPALILKSRSPLVVYAAGDFSDNGVSRGGYGAVGKVPIKKFFSFLDGDRKQSEFFWGFYVPYMSNVVSNLKRGF